MSEFARPLIAGVLMCIACASAAQGQAVSDAAVNSTQVYDEAFFRQYNLPNAEEMLRRLPGVSALLDSGAAATSQGRGLGAGTEQILIDGKRTTSKSDSVAAVLRRISADRIQRIELIRGATSEVRSEGLIVNVVLKAETGHVGAGNAELNYRFDDMGWGGADGLISYSDAIGALTYALGVDHTVWTTPLGLNPSGGVNDWTVRRRDEGFYYPSGAVQELRPQRWRRSAHRTAFTASAAYNFAGGGILRVNGLYQPNPVIQTNVTNLTRFSQSGVATSRATEIQYNANRRDTTELGGEYERSFGPGVLNVIGLRSRSKLDLLDYRNRFEASGALVELGRSANAQALGEDVLRGSFAWPAFRRHNLTVGGEVARNSLAQSFEVFADQNRDGRLELIVTPTANARVAEIRGESFMTDDWKITPSLTLTSALTFEISRITTNYPAIPVRVLRYFKPRFDLRFNPNSTNSFRAKAERQISQLDFASFVPVYNIVDSRVDLGNPLLVPQRAWIFEAGYERRLPEDKGTLGARLFYRYFRDGVVFVPYGYNSAGLPISARGNLPTPNFVGGVELNAAVRLTALGLPGAQLSARLLKNVSETIDAFTDTRRKGSSAYYQEYSLGFRHDITRWKAAYGVDYLKTDGPQIVSDVRNFETQTRGPRVNLFAEKTLSPKYAIRLEAYGVNGVHEIKSRRIYAVSQRDGALSRLEAWDERRDRRFVVKIRGKF